MIGFLAVALSTMLLMLLGYSLIMGTFLMFMNIAILIALIGITLIALSGLLWEFYFQQPAKHIIANRRCAAWEWAVDDLGYAQLVPSNKYMPQGLVLWKFGWNLLPRPIQKFDFIERLTGRPKGRPPKDPAKAEAKQKESEARQKQVNEIGLREQEMIEQLSSKKCIWKGLGKPVWFNYLGLAGNFNPYILVPSEVKQDNPHSYLALMKDYVSGLADLSVGTKKDLLQKITDMETRLDHLRVVIDPRKFKEILPSMYTQSQIDAHGQIHEEIGRLSVNGLPLGKILLVLLIGGVVIAAVAAVYFLFLKPQQAADLIVHIHHRLLGP